MGATLFSGIGAPEVAMPHWRWPWHAEIERFPSAVMAARHPHSINIGDVSIDDFAERAGEIARPDVLVFGSPCQSYSVAGKRLGLDDPRGNLALVALGIVDRLKPDWFVFENVPGLLSSSGGRDFGIFLRTVDELGYSGAWASLDAQWFGVAQRRERVFFVGHIGDWRGPAAVLLEPESLCGHSPPRREAGQGFTHAVAPSLTSSGCGVERGGDTRGQDPLVATRDVSHCLNAGGRGRIDASEDGTGRETPITISPPLAFSSKDNGADVGDIAPTLRAMGHTDSHPNAGGQVAVAFQSSQSGVREVDTHATLDANNGSRRHNGVNVGSAVRRLTPRECERLMGFEDDYTLVDFRGKPAADGNRYHALGNSMAVPVMRWILTRIEQFHKREAA